MELRQVPTDETLDALLRPTRRALVRRLRESGTLSIERAAELLAEFERDGDEGQRTDGTNHVRLQLHHVHVPKLADADVIEYDPETGTIEPGVNARLAYEVLDVVSKEERRD